MIYFDEMQEGLYYSNVGKEVLGTGFLAFRDILQFCINCEMNFEKVLDLGCGAGRSTKIISSFCNNVYATDISEKAISIASGNVSSAKYFINKPESLIYEGAPFNIIFCILTLFHFSSVGEIKQEIYKCFASINKGDFLFIVNGTLDLYKKKYSSVSGVGPHPKKDGDLCKIYLRNVDCLITDCYWSSDFIIKIAMEAGFSKVYLDFPVGRLEDKQNYIEEYNFPPYFYLGLRK